MTTVYLGEILTVAQLTGLKFLATSGVFGKNSTFSYSVTDPSGAKASGSATLAIGPDTIPPITTAASLTVADNAAATAIGIVAPTDANYAPSQLTITVTGLPNGGNAAIKNNVIEQGRMFQNRTIIAFGEEGSVYASSSLQVTGNQILNDLSNSGSTAVWNATGTTNPPSITAQITGNQFWGLTSSQVASGSATQSSNLFLTTEPALVTMHPWSY